LQRRNRENEECKTKMKGASALGMNDTPSGERTHVGFFGRRNAGKSSIVNAINEIWNSIRDEVGTVTSINGITPDGTGNIDISPTDLGCVGNPINKGYDGQFLMTDGSGNTYWSDVDPGTDVTVTQTITSGIEIARIKVGSNTVPLYAPSYADVNDRGF
jgi:hypothetical protein